MPNKLGRELLSRPLPEGCTYVPDTKVRATLLLGLIDLARADGWSGPALDAAEDRAGRALQRERLRTTRFAKYKAEQAAEKAAKATSTQEAHNG